MKKISLFLSFCFVLLFVKAQPETGDFSSAIIWNDTTKLTWSDFKAKAIPNAAEAAMTASSMEFSYNTKNSKIFWNVKVKFFPFLSWTKTAEQSDYILKHEQLHFDITELYARLLRKRLAENIHSSKDIQQLRAINKNILREWQNEQDKYDRETNHSINKAKQIEWNLSIQNRLNALLNYASN